jgi:hypothetical protein
MVIIPRVQCAGRRVGASLVSVGVIGIIGIVVIVPIVAPSVLVLPIGFILGFVPYHYIMYRLPTIIYKLINSFKFNNMET